MIEKRLEDIISDYCFLDPEFSRIIYAIKNKDTTEDRKQDGILDASIGNCKDLSLDPDEVWSCFTQEIMKSPGMSSYMEEIGNNHLAEDLELIKPIVFLILFYLADDYRFRSESTKKNEEDLAYINKKDMDPADIAIYLKKQRRRRNQWYGIEYLDRIKSDGKNESIEDYQRKRNSKIELRQVQKTIPQYLKRILLTSPDYMNPAFNIKGDDLAERLERFPAGEHLSNEKYIYSQNISLKRFFFSEQTLYFQKIYSDLDYDGYKYTFEESTLKTKEDKTLRVQKTYAYINEKSDGFQYIVNYLTTLFPLMLTCLTSMSGHRNTLNGKLNIQDIAYIDKAILQWLPYPLTESSIPDKQEKKILDKILIFWAIEDCLKRKRFNTAFVTSFQFFQDHKILPPKRNARKHQVRILRACSLLLNFPLPFFPEAYKHDFDLFLTGIIGENNRFSVNSDKALYRLLFFTEVLFPNAIHVMAALLFAKNKVITEIPGHSKLELDKTRIKQALPLLQNNLIENERLYTEYYDPRTTIRIQCNTISGSALLTHAHANPEDDEDLDDNLNDAYYRQQFLTHSTIPTIAVEPFEAIKSDINRELSYLKFENVFFELTDPINGLFSITDTINRKGLLTTMLANLNSDNASDFVKLCTSSTIKVYLEEKSHLFKTNIISK